MKVYECKVCGNRLYFENSVCVGCGTYLGFSRADDDIVPVDSHGVYVDARGTQQHVCRNLDLSGCTWLTEVEGGQCSACAMTRTRPSDADAKGIAEFPVAERAKRQLLAELDRLGFVVADRATDPERGLCFDMLSSVDENVVIGHADGVITIDLAEGDATTRVADWLGLDESFATNVLTAERSKIALECLNNIDSLPATGATLVIGPTKLVGGSGAPASVTALVPR